MTQLNIKSIKGWFLNHFSTNLTQGILFLSLFVLISGCTSCSNEISFQKSSVVPAAEATFNIKKDNNDNYRIEVEVENLAKPSQLTPSKKFYIVWIESERHGTFNIGKLTVNDKLSGALTGLTPYKPKRILITAENDARPTNPGSQQVLTSDNLKVK